jgi:hypothetical protein
MPVEGRSLTFDMLWIRRRDRGLAKACAPQCFWFGLLLKELYPKAKGIPESRQVKSIGKPDALNAPVRFDVAGTGNEAKAVGLRTEAKATDYPPMPIVLAPVLDPTEIQAGNKGHMFLSCVKILNCKQPL